MFKQQLESILRKTFENLPVELFRNNVETGATCTLYYFPHDIRVIKKEGFLYFDMAVDLMINETNCGKGIGWLTSRLNWTIYDEKSDPFDDNTLGLKLYGEPEDYYFDSAKNHFNIKLTVNYTAKIQYNKTREEIKFFNIENEA